MNKLIILAIIIGIVGCIWLTFYLVTRCPANYYKNNKKICTHCIPLLFTLEKGTCTANTDSKNLDAWLKSCYTRLTAKDANIKNVSEEISNEFAVWLVSICDINPVSQLKIYDDIQKLLLDMTAQNPDTNTILKDWQQIITDGGFCNLMGI